MLSGCDKNSCYGKIKLNNKVAKSLILKECCLILTNVVKLSKNIVKARKIVFTARTKCCQGKDKMMSRQGK